MDISPNTCPTPYVGAACYLIRSVMAPSVLPSRSSTPIQWKTLEDLTPYRIGVVQDYVNTAALDLRFAQRKQAFDPARDDTQNLLKLAAGRIALAVVDQRVFDHLMHHAPQLTAYKDKLAFNSRPLEIKQLFICFRPSAKAGHSRSMVNAGLRQLASTRRSSVLPKAPTSKP